MTGESHGRTVVVWDVPPAIECGASFAIKLGVKCGSDCPPDAWVLDVRDHSGCVVAVATPESEPWSGTRALYCSTVELTAPEDPGLYAWEATAPAADADANAEADAEPVPVHDEARSGFNVRVVPEAECRLTVVAVDKETRTPVPNARVVVHPYRATTDERGIAELKLPHGQYRLFVSGREFLPFRSDGELTADATVQAELESDAGPSDAELWS